MMIGQWISSHEINKRQQAITPEDIPICSLCLKQPDHAGKIVAGRDNIFLCRGCIENACEVLKDTGFPVD